MFKIFAVSDSIGETAEQVAHATASQFSSEIEIERVPYIKTIKDVNDFIDRIKHLISQKLQFYHRSA